LRRPGRPGVQHPLRGRAVRRALRPGRAAPDRPAETGPAGLRRGGHLLGLPLRHRGPDADPGPHRPHQPALRRAARLRRLRGRQGAHGQLHGRRLHEHLQARPGRAPRAGPRPRQQRGKGMRLEGRVAIVTRAGGGLGRPHALYLARQGARVVVNDVDQSAADAVAAEIAAASGQAIGVAASVTDEAAVAAMVERTLKTWSRIDILINNAGILRDKSFAKMDLADFRLVVDVHLMGAAICSKAVWEVMRSQNYGRIVMTTSSSGLYGNFGQANYGAAKMALVGLMQTLAIEGEKYGIKVNCLAPTAATGMTAGILPEASLALRSEEHTSELQSRENLVCRLLLEKKK